MTRTLLATLLSICLAAAPIALADPIAANSATPIAATPPMGFNNWARFQCLAQPPLDGRDAARYGFQDFMLDQAQAMVDTGLAAAGYRTVVVDDCWMERGTDGRLHGIARWGSYKHPSRQPGFDHDLAGYVARLHALGMRAGLYNTAGTTTCQRVAAGEAGHQAADAAQFAHWGIDFLKLDNCGASDAELPVLFRTMGEALGSATAATGRPILFDESAPAQYAPTDPQKYRTMRWVRALGQMWRVAPDIRVTHVGADGRPLYDPWDFDDADQGYEEGVYQSFTDAIALSRYVAPGNWNDADQLLIGDNGLTTAEERSQMALWSIMGAPLILSADVRRMARERSDPHFAESLAILTNRRLIAIDQDPLGAGGYLVMRDHSANDTGVDVALKPLADGGFAVAVLNKNPIAIDYSLPLALLGVAQTGCPLAVTDAWTGATRTVEARGALTGRIAAHDTLVARVAASACAAPTPSGQIYAAQSRFAAPPLCLQAADDGALTIESCTASARQQWRMERDGRIALANGGGCLTAGTAAALAVAPCGAALPRQRFAYHLSGALMTADRRCLTVAAGKVGNGGLIGQQGAAVRLDRCRADAPDQAFSAPHIGAPPA